MIRRRPVLCSLSAALAGLALLSTTAPALAWGPEGHRLVGRAAMRSLPAAAPAFLRSPQAEFDVGELSREPDRTKNAGKEHDSLRDFLHFMDLDENDKVLGAVSLDALPPTIGEYDTLLRAAGSTMYKEGAVYYGIVDGYQQITADLAYVRAFTAALRFTKSAERRRFYAAELRRRRELTLRDIGYLSHFVGDACQPLHVSIHYNGWGDYPNPQGFTQERIHGPFESVFVQDNVTLNDVLVRVAPHTPCAGAVQTCVVQYLKTTNAQVTPFYVLEKAGAFRSATPAGRDFAAARLGAGAAMLRTLIADAWTASAGSKVGWPLVPVAEIESGKVDPWENLKGRL